MANDLSDKRMHELFRLLSDAERPEAPPPGDHPVDDVDLLVDLSLGNLDDARRRSFSEHLEHCRYCRQELALMIHSGALELPLAEETSPPRAARRGVGYGRTPRWLAAAATVAVVVAIVFVLSRPDDRHGAAIDLARSDLEQGRPRAAFDRLDALLGASSSLEPNERRQAELLIEEAAYRAVKEQLPNKYAAPEILALEQRLAERAGSSARLVNLRLQAERGEDIERSLAQSGSLVEDFGYERDGERYIMSVEFPPPSETTARLENEFHAAIAAHPASLDLRLNLADLLLETRRFAEAEKEFARAAEIAPNSALAETGLGLAIYQQKGDEQPALALPHFRRAVELAPDDATTNLNLAVCLARLGQMDEARTFFDKADAAE